MPDAEPLRVLGLLSAPDRLRAFSALVLAAGTTEDVAQRTGLRVRDALRAISQLEQGGLVGREGHCWIAHAEALRNVVAAASSPADPPVDPPPAGDHSGEEEAAVIRAFTREGRILAMPVQRAKRLVLLDYVARTFEPGVRYTEAEVNALLRPFYADHALLRRSLVDEGFMDRDSAHYWRCGGTVDV